MRLIGLLILSVATLPSWAQQQSARLEPDPVMERLTATALDFESRAHLAGRVTASVRPAIVVDTSPQLSKYTSQDNVVHTARWEELPPPVRDFCNRLAGYAGDTSGEQLFGDMFHRFFFVHEFAHWPQRQGKDSTNGAYEFELQANRITVAYWREKDSEFLSALLARFERIHSRLPNPVPPGQDPEKYFDDNYRGMGSNPDLYGWFQMRMVLQAGAERPQLTFSDALRTLPPTAAKSSPE